MRLIDRTGERILITSRILCAFPPSRRDIAIKLNSHGFIRTVTDNTHWISNGWAWDQVTQDFTPMAYWTLNRLKVRS